MDRVLGLSRPPVRRIGRVGGVALTAAVGVVLLVVWRLPVSSGRDFEQYLVAVRGAGLVLRRLATSRCRGSASAAAPSSASCSWSGRGIYTLMIARHAAPAAGELGARHPLHRQVTVANDPQATPAGAGRDVIARLDADERPARTAGRQGLRATDAHRPARPGPTRRSTQDGSTVRTSRRSGLPGSSDVVAAVEADAVDDVAAARLPTANCDDRYAIRDVNDKTANTSRRRRDATQLRARRS